jgi:hypothetical protein
MDKGMLDEGERKINLGRRRYFSKLKTTLARNIAS